MSNRDPRVKHAVLNSLLNDLYTEPMKLLKYRLQEIIIKNTVASMYNHNSFMYKGKWYNCDSTPRPRKNNRLLPELTLVMNDYLKDEKLIIEDEYQYVSGYIKLVLEL